MFNFIKAKRSVTSNTTQFYSLIKGDESLGWKGLTGPSARPNKGLLFNVANIFQENKYIS